MQIYHNLLFLPFPTSLKCVVYTVLIRICAISSKMECYTDAQCWQYFFKRFSDCTYLQLQNGVHSFPTSAQISSTSTQYVFESPMNILNPIKYIIKKDVINKLITNRIINSNLQGHTCLFLCSLNEWLD